MSEPFVLSKINAPPQSEGALYRIIEIFGEVFEIYYGYYEECERENPNVEPMPIYPDFLINPQFTKDGYPFVTKMQDACRFYKGKPSKFSECAECSYYRHGDDFLGICGNDKNKRKKVEENK